MKKETKTIAQQLGVKKFPFIIKHDNEEHIYYEDSNGYWYRCKFDSNGNKIYYDDSDGYWSKREFDSNGNPIYFETSNGYWSKSEYDSNNIEIYYEDSDGKIINKRPKVVELSIEEIAKKLGIDTKLIKIVDK